MLLRGIGLARHLFSSGWNSSFILGMEERLADLADAKNDPVGLQLEAEHLPKRIRIPQKPSRSKER